jgi:2-phospho-L-lactate guanylyltransferase
MRRGPVGDPLVGDRAVGDLAAAVVVPLRSFLVGKGRLSDVLDDDARAELVRTMADAVIDAAGARPLVVVSGAPEVAAWCTARRLERVDDPGSLDAAADAGRAWARAQGLARVVVVHADLPLVTSLDAVAGDGDAPVAVVVPDHHVDGTPVLSLPVAAPFRFSYGPGSFARHVAEATRVGLEPRVVRDRALGFDVDVPADLDALDRRTS